MPTNVDKYFTYKHLPENLQEVSKLFSDLQCQLEEIIPDNAEKSAGMRLLLQCKDCMVRARL